MVIYNLDGLNLSICVKTCAYGKQNCSGSEVPPSNFSRLVSYRYLYSFMNMHVCTTHWLRTDYTDWEIRALVEQTSRGLLPKTLPWPINLSLLVHAWQSQGCQGLCYHYRYTLTDLSLRLMARLFGNALWSAPPIWALHSKHFFVSIGCPHWKRMCKRRSDSITKCTRIMRMYRIPISSNLLINKHSAVMILAIHLVCYSLTILNSLRLLLIIWAYEILGGGLHQAWFTYIS